ncbi:MAG: hypothetical protein VW338_00825 [Rhodospirillaceae bacterium]
MAVESAADRAAFVNPDEFGVTATLTAAASGEQATVNGVLFDGEDTVFAGPGVMSGPIRFRCRTADLPAGAAHGDSLVIGSDHYAVAVRADDGTGMTDLQLEQR